MKKYSKTLIALAVVAVAVVLFFLFKGKEPVQEIQF